MNEPEQFVGILTTDRELVIRSWDEQLAEATGISAKQAVGRRLEALAPDLEARGLGSVLRQAVTDGSVALLAPALHHYLIPVPLRRPSAHFERMQQHVTAVPLREGPEVVGLLLMVEDVTARLEGERELSERLEGGGETGLPPGGSQAEAGAGWRVRRSLVDHPEEYRRPEVVAAVLRALHDSHTDLSVLNSALQVLALTEIDVIAPLIGFLSDPDPNVRLYAALALGDRQADEQRPRAVRALLRALDDPDTNVRYHAVEALGKLRASEAVESLARIVETRDFFLAFAALDALVQIGSPVVAPRLAPLLDDDLLRVPAASALGHLGDESVVGLLTGLLGQSTATTRAAGQALAALYERYEQHYGEGTAIADQARAEIDGPRAAALLAALDGAAAEELEALAIVLGWLDQPEILQALIQLLGQPAARRAVVRALVKHGPQVTPFLIEHLEAEDPETCRAAIVALGQIGDRRAVPALVRLLAAESPLAVMAAAALGKIGDRRAFEPLLPLLAHADAAVRQAAVGALNSLGHPAMPARIATLLGDENPHVRESAAKIAGYFGYAEAVEALLARCHDPDESVRAAALEHVAYLDDPRVMPLLVGAAQTESPRARTAAVRGLGQLESAAAMPYLLAALTDRDAWVRYFATRALGRRREAGALPALAELAQTDPAPPVRIAAIEALGVINDERATTVLTPLAASADPNVGRAALLALGRIGHPDALLPLLEALRSPLDERRLDAIEALRQRSGLAAVAPLEWAAASDPNPHVSQAAVNALASLATAEAVAALVRLLAGSQARSEPCIKALAGLGEQHLDEIGRGLRHELPLVRRAVVEALARMKRPLSSELLSTALDDEAAEVRQAAAGALRSLGSHRAQARLAEMARSDPDPAVRRAAQGPQHR